MAASLASPSASSPRLDGLRSRVGRRVLAAFVLCAVVPLLTFAGFSLASVTARLELEATERLQWTGKQIAMGLLERLLTFDAELERVAAVQAGARADRPDADPLPERSDVHFRGIARTDTAGFRALSGEVREIAPLDEHVRVRLESGAPALRVTADDRGPCVELLRAIPGAPGAFVVGQVEPEALWGRLSRMSLFDVHVFGRGGELLFATAPDGTAPRPPDGLVSDGTAAEVRQDPDGDLHADWSLFLRPSFGVDDWTVVTSQPRQVLYGPVRTFAWTFLLVLLLSLLAVGFLSTVQIRRNLGPIRALEASTERIAEGDLSERVAIESGDEFESLADRFNEMASRLERDERQGRALETLGHEALGSTDPSEFFEAAVPAVRASLDADCCAYFERDPEGDGRTSWSCRTHSGWPESSARERRWQPGSLPPPPEPRLAYDLEQEEDLPLPPTMRGLGLRSAAVVGVARGDETFGMLAVFSRRAEWFGEPEGRFLRGVSQLLGTALDRARIEGALHESREQLLQAQKLEAIGQLASGVAHDFNNVLTAITGASELALDATPDEAVEAEIREIQAAAQRGTRISRQLLGMARKSDPDPIALDVGAAVQDLCGMLRRLLPGTIQLHVNAPQELPHVVADRGQLEQIVTNLVVNARDAMPDGGRIHVDVHEVHLDAVSASRFENGAPGHFVQLTVLDEGTGIPDDVIDRIFEPLFTTKELGSGTGLGLANVAELVKAHEGRIGVWSEPGRWTRFEVILPVAAATEAKARLTVAPTPARPETGTAPETRATVLVVDDDPAVLRLATRALERGGLRTLCADSATAALQAAEREPGRIDLLATDQNMPGMTGTELASRLRMLRPETRVLMISGDSDDAPSDPGVSSLPKPFGPADLLAAVNAAIGGGSGDSDR